MARTYRCPVCNKPLTKKEFERAFKIHEAQKEHVEERERKLQADRQQFEAQKKKIREEERWKQQQRTSRVVAGYQSKLRALRDKLEALKRGKTQQEFGPDFEITLVKRLQNEFPADDIHQTKGSRGGDVIHVVKEVAKDAGLIIYECKREPRISRSHIQQAAHAKMVRNAQFAVLVTCGTRRGFSGLDAERGVTIVSPAGVLALAGLLRAHLIEMYRAGVEKKRRTKIANHLLKFIKSPEFKNPIEEIVRTAEILREGIQEEFRWHKNDWERRWNAYGKILWDGRSIEENVQRVFHGEAPKQVVPPKERLALVAPPDEIK